MRLWPAGSAPAAKNRELRPYANEPEDIRPYSNFTAPNYSNYEKLVEYNGVARDVPVVKPSEIEQVRIGLLGPVENHRDERPGRMIARSAAHWPGGSTAASV